LRICRKMLIYRGKNRPIEAVLGWRWEPGSAKKIG
jgi:hypothetical protein